MMRSLTLGIFVAFVAAVGAAVPLAPLFRAASSVSNADVQVVVEIPTKLTLDAALLLARSRGIDLLLADAAVANAGADGRIATAITNPQLSVARGVTRTYDASQCAGCSDVAWTMGLSDQGALLDTVIGKRALRGRVASSALAAARFSRADAERTLILAVKQQYLACTLAQRSLVNARTIRESTAETLRLVEVRYHAGAVSEADVARAETAKLESDQNVQQAEQTLGQARAALAFLLGARSLTPEFTVGDEFLRAATPDALAHATPDDILRDALAHRPDLKAERAQVERASAGLAAARRQRIPDVSVTLQYSREGSGQSAIQPPTTAIGIGFNLPLFYQGGGEVAKARADLRTQELQVTRSEAQVALDVASAFAAFFGARDRVSRMETRLLDRTQRARDLVKIQYEHGAASLLELLDAQRMVVTANQEYVQSLNDYWIAVFQLEAAAATEMTP